MHALDARGRFTSGLHVPAVVVVASVICLAGCSSSSSSGSDRSATPSASPSQGGGAAARPQVSSSLDGRRQLPLRVHWRAVTSTSPSDVSEVDFLIDGRLGWVEHQPPYDYADDGNWLVSSFLKPGIAHTFSVRLVTVDGQNATDTVTAKVSASSPPPAALAGTWRRVVTAKEAAGAGSDGPPAGVWRYTFTREGFIGHDPQNGGGISDIAYLPNNRLQLRPTIEHPPFPSPNNGGFCGDTDPLAIWTYSISNGGRTLTLQPDHGHDPCASRQALLAGVWTRTAPDPKAHALATS